MRTYGSLPPALNHEAIVFPPDSVQTLLLASSAGQAIDWPASATGGTTAARTVSAHIVRFTAFTTAAAPVPTAVMVNLVSTHANNPTSGSSVTTGTTVGSTGNSIPVHGSRTFSIPAWSTGWSAICLGGAYLVAEVWRV